jgi:hypothetical protein
LKNLPDWNGFFTYNPVRFFQTSSAKGGIKKFLQILYVKDGQFSCQPKDAFRILSYGELLNSHFSSLRLSTFDTGIAPSTTYAQTSCRPRPGKQLPAKHFTMAQNSMLSRQFLRT